MKVEREPGNSPLPAGASDLSEPGKGGARESAGAARDLLERIRGGRLDPRPAAELLGLPFDQDIITGILQLAADVPARAVAVEPVARAIYDSANKSAGHSGDWDKVPEPFRSNILGHARAAISAMREHGDTISKAETEG